MDDGVSMFLTVVAERKSGVIIQIFNSPNFSVRFEDIFEDSPEDYNLQF